MLTSPRDALLLAVLQHPLPWHIDAVGGRPPHRLQMLSRSCRIPLAGWVGWWLGMRLPVSTYSEPGARLALRLSVPFGIVGFVIGPGAPEYADLCPGEDADGVRMIAATLSSLGIHASRPGALVPGVVGEAGQRGS